MVLVIGLLVLGGLVAASSSGLGGGVVLPARQQQSARAHVAKAYGKLPLSFEANRGQTDPRVRFLSRGSGYTLFLTPREAVLSLSRAVPARAAAGSGLATSRPPGPGRADHAAVHMRFVGANPRPKVVGIGRTAGTSNYLIGRDPKAWHTGVPSYGAARYRGIYPGVDLAYHGKQGRLEYDFRVAAGADPGQIALDFSGARKVSLDRRGDLVLRTTAGVLRQHRPLIYQQVGGARKLVPGRFVVRGGRVGFRVGRYDHSRPLVIDPVLVYSTYLGGVGGERGNGVAVDASGSAYVAGFTTSADFPVTDHAYQSIRTGDASDIFDTDAFVTKFGPGGKLVYSTFLGGGGALDFARGVAVDGSGRAYVAGETQSHGFPTTAGAFEPTAPPSFGTAFVSVLDADGSHLVYSTYLGGRGSDGGETATGIAVDAARNAYVTGGTSSTDFPTKSPGAQPLQGSLIGSGDAFVSKLDTSAAGDDSLVYSTYLGGADYDGGNGIAVDQAGAAYVAGYTGSADFPTQNPLPGQAAGKGGSDGFVSKLNPSGSVLSYSTYLAGTNVDSANAVAVDGTGHAYVAGQTKSDDFPIQNAFQAQRGKRSPDDGGSDAFVSELSPEGSALAYSSYLGGRGDDVGTGIALDASGGAYVVGEADAPGGVEPGSFPTVDPLAAPAAQGDAFVARVKPGGSGLSLSSYLGGGGEEEAYGVAVDSSGSAYLTGDAVSTDFPTRHAFQGRSAGRGVGDRRDVFLAKVSPGDATAPLVTGLSHRSGPGGTSVVITGRGLTGAGAVRFGAVAASAFTVDSDGQITTKAPSGASGAVPVTVTTPAGDSPPNPIATFTYAQGTWDLTGSLRRPRQEGETATLLSDGRVLVAGGCCDAIYQSLDSAEVYDPSTGTWSTRASLGSARYDFTATLLPDGRVLAAGGTRRVRDATGQYQATQLDTAELYDPASGAWTPTGSMTQGRSRHTATLLPNGKVLVVGGLGTSSYDGIDSAELYDPDTGRWSAADSLHDHRMGHTATLLASGRVLIAGGCCDSQNGGLDSAEVYDPTLNRFETTGSLAVGRDAHTATRLGDGRVLITGGEVRISSLASAEIYDPASGNFADAPAMPHRRAGAAAALLSNGKVLVAGGTETNSSHDTADLYDPATGGWGPAGVMSHYRGFGFGGQMVFAVALTGGEVLVGGDSQSSGPTTELYNPEGPAAATPDQTAAGQAPGSETPGSETPGSETSGATPGAPAGGLTLDRVAPVISGFGLTHDPFVVGARPTPAFGFAAALRHKRGTTFIYRLSEAARASIAISRRRSGRRNAAGRCVAPARALRHAKRCTRIIRRGTLGRMSRRGANRVGFSGRIGSRALEPGRYGARLVATDAAKNASRPKTITFTIARR